VDPHCQENPLEAAFLSDDILKAHMPAELTEFDFAVDDELDGKPLTPDNVNLPILRSFLADVEAFVKGDVQGITLNESKVKIEHGSLKVKMLVGTALAVSVQTDLEKLNETGDLDLIHPRRAEVIEKWQSRAEKSSKRHYFIAGSNLTVHIDGHSRFEHANEKAWVNVEKYFTGKVFNAGGKQAPNIHVDLAGGQTIRIDATESQLAAVEDNVLFKELTLRVQAEQHLQTKELRNLRLIEFLPHADEVDEKALESLWAKGAEAWKGVGSATDWVEKIRGNK
jgi:hypothetical protein